MSSLLYFRADECGVCVAKLPVARRIAGELGLTLEVVDLEEEDGRRRAAELRVETVPTLALVDGDRVPFRLVGRMITPETVRHILSISGRRPAGS